MVAKRKGIQSVEIGLGVLDALVRLGRPSTLSEVAKESDLSASQAHRYLASFVNMGFLRQDPVSSLYDLHTGALRLGLAAMARLDVFDEASRVAHELVEATGRTVLLAIWSDFGPTIIRWYPGSPPIYTTLAIGSHLSLTHSATGRVFLAFQNETYVSDFLQKELVLERTDGPVDIDAIRQHVRRDLVGRVEGTLIPGLRAMAAPVFDLQGQLTLVVSTIASQSFSPSEDDKVKDRLVAAAREITHRLGGRWPEPR